MFPVLLENSQKEKSGKRSGEVCFGKFVILCFAFSTSKPLQPTAISFQNPHAHSSTFKEYENPCNPHEDRAASLSSLGSGGSGLFRSGGGSRGRGFEGAGPDREGNAVSSGPSYWPVMWIRSGMIVSNWSFEIFLGCVVCSVSETCE